MQNDTAPRFDGHAHVWPESLDDGPLTGTCRAISDITLRLDVALPSDVEPVTLFLPITHTTWSPCTAEEAEGHTEENCSRLVFMGRLPNVEREKPLVAAPDGLLTHFLVAKDGTLTSSNGRSISWSTGAMPYATVRGAGSGSTIATNTPPVEQVLRVVVGETPIPLNGVNAYLNGDLVERCVEADEERGYVIVYRDGERETRYGTVQLVFTKPEYRQRTAEWNALNPRGMTPYERTLEWIDMPAPNSSTSCKIAGHSTTIVRSMDGNTLVFYPQATTSEQHIAIEIPRNDLITHITMYGHNVELATSEHGTKLRIMVKPIG